MEYDVIIKTTFAIGERGDVNCLFLSLGPLGYFSVISVIFFFCHERCTAVTACTFHHFLLI